MQQVIDDKKSEALIQRLCSLGLDSRLMVPKLLRLLHSYIPSFANVYFWLANDGSVVDIYDEFPESYAALPLYLSEYYNNKELEVWDGLQGATNIRSAVDMDQLWKIDKQQLLKHDFYQDFLKPIGQLNGLHRSIYVNGRARGILQLKRNIGDPAYSQENVQKLNRVAVHIEHAIKNQHLEPERLNNSAIEEATLIVDARGKIHHYTDKAERIIMFSQDNKRIDHYSRFSYSKLPPLLCKLVSQLQRIERGENLQPATKTINNRWGMFTFSVTPLNQQQEPTAIKLYVLQIEHFVPLKIKLLDALDSFELSNRQFEVCLHISTGKSYSEIAELMCVKESTVITHRKALFGKLGVSNRHQLNNVMMNGLLQ